MHLTPRHILAIVDATFEKYQLAPLEEGEDYIIKDAIEAVTDGLVVSTMLRMIDEPDYDPEEEAIMAALDAAFMTCGIITSDLLQHGEQRW